MSWNQISRMAEQNILQNYAAIGDSKPFKMTGVVDGTTVTGSCLASIVAFEHNPSIEGTGRVTFAIKNDDSNKYKRVFVDSHYGQNYTDSDTFSHNTQSGWQKSHIRSVCRQFYDCMPDDLKAVIVSQHKYTDNIGGINASVGNISVSSDKLWIPSEYEVFGEITYSNPYEANAQAHYSSYYANSAARHGYKTGNTKQNWHLRSHAFGDIEDQQYKFCIVVSGSNSSDAGFQYGTVSYGIALHFAVGGQRETVWTSGADPTVSRTYTWQEVKEKIVAGNTDNFSIGDTFEIYCDSFELDNLLGDNVVSSTINPGKLFAVIIGIDHNSEIEGSNRIHFQIMKYSHDTLQDTESGLVLSPVYNNMSFANAATNLSNTNAGGWKCCYARRKIMTDIFAALPESLRRVITPVKKYTDNIAGTTVSVKGNISHTYDYLFVPSEYEIFGTITKGNTNEADYQKIYDFYKINTDKKYRGSYNYYGIDGGKSSTRKAWILRTPNSSGQSYLNVSGGSSGYGSIADFNSSDGNGLPVCFTIGKEDTVDTTKTEYVNKTSSSAFQTLTIDNLRPYTYNGTIQNYFSIGDEIDIQLSDFYLRGSDGYHLIRGGLYQAVIIDFNHNSAVEEDKTIHFMICRKGGLSIAFPCASMNNSDTNSGGWNSSNMLKENMDAVLKAMPSAWQSLITACKKYSDNTGNASGTEKDVLTSKSSKVWLPSFYEIYGTNTLNGVVMSSPFEADHQQQYAYFKTIINKTEGLSDATIQHYAYDGDTEFCRRIIPCWTRSTAPDSSDSFVLSVNRSSAIKGSASEKYGITPCFMIKGTSGTATVVNVDPPTVSGTSFTYDGSAKGPTITMPTSNEDQINVINATGINADTYTLEFELKDKNMHQWSDTKDTENKTYNYKINQAAGSFNLDKTSVECTESAQNQTVKVTRTGNGTVNAVSCDTKIADVTVSGTNIIIQGKANGSTTVKVTIAAGTNHKAVSAAKTIDVSVVLGQKADQYSWKQIAQMSADGTVFNYLTVGDKKTVKVNGTYEGITISGTYYAVLLSSSYHNPSVEGENISQWGIIENLNSTNIAFVSSEYNKYINDGTPGFAHKLSSGSLSRGWEESYIREFLNEEFIKFLPLDLRSYIFAVTKYSNIDNSGTTISTTDRLWLPSGIETQKGNEKLGNNQEKFNYFEISHNFYRHDKTDSKVTYWLRSSSDTNRTHMRTAGYNSNSCSNDNPNASHGITPCFAVGM